MNNNKKGEEEEAFILINQLGLKPLLIKVVNWTMMKNGTGT